MANSPEFRILDGFHEEPKIYKLLIIHISGAKGVTVYITIYSNKLCKMAWSRIDKTLLHGGSIYKYNFSD